MRRLLCALALVAATTAACGSDQDPGVPAVPESGNGSVTTTTSRGLARCPEGGPDSTTPAAGCLDDEGNVVH